MSNTKEKPVKRKKGKKSVVMMVIMFFGLAPVLKYGLLIFIFGLLPWLVAWYVDTSHDRYLSRVVGACNFAGVLPMMLKLWRQGITFDNMWAMLTNPTIWLIMYGAAAFGWLLMWFFPQAVHVLLSFKQSSGATGLRNKQQEIVDEWGMQVEAASRKALRNATYGEEYSSRNS